ncbi:MAG TPA: complex I NDUFA9 subunit family protein [Anaerolineales bacterium]|nr:complex I NDUFA9 subunit family protein [Anaerolineales bacterium]
MIVITGASGYIGSHITRRLVDAGRPVRALVFNRQHSMRESRLSGLPVEMKEADVTRPETLENAFEDASAVIHTTAIAIEKGKQTYEQVNYQGTVNVVEAARRAGTRRLINMSQLGADARLPYRFLASKGRAQDYIAASGLDWTAFRPSVVWGPEDEFANTFARLVRVTPIIFPIVGDEKSRFQPVWVEDVVTCFVSALDDPSTIGFQYELGGPEILTLEEIERRALQAVGARRWMIHFPMPILRLVVTLMEKVLPNPPVTRNLLELLAVSNVTQKNEIRKFVNDPRPLKPEFTADYMRQFTARDTVARLFGKR